MRAFILPRPDFLGCLAVAALLGACASSGVQSPQATAPCGPNCKGLMLAMGYTANLSGGINLGNDPNTNTLQRITATTDKRIDCALTNVEVLGGNWTRVWGPVVVLESNSPEPGPAQVPANTVFVARQKNANVYVIAIAGTNSASLFDWKDEDLNANPVLWPGTSITRGIRVTQGTLTGLQILEGMQSGDNPPVTLLNLVTQIAGQSSASNKATIYITGHSLGGALAPALGLWLAGQKSTWDPNSNTALQVYTFAGATPGDRSFAKYMETFFPGAEDLVVVDNSLDVVPHAFRLDTLKELDTLYLGDPTACQANPAGDTCIFPTSAEKADIQKAIDGAQKAADALIYFATLGKASQVQGFQGTLQSKSALATGLNCSLLSAPGLDDYAKEAIYQHVCAYPPALGVPTLNTKLGACRAEYPNG